MHFLVSLSQSSAATLVTWGGWDSNCHMSFIRKKRVLKPNNFFTKLKTKIS